MLKASEGGKSLQLQRFCSSFQSLAAKNWKERRPKEELASGVTRDIPYVRRRVGKRMGSACVVPTVKHRGGGAMVWGCFAGDTV